MMKFIKQFFCIHDYIEADSLKEVNGILDVTETSLVCYKCDKVKYKYYKKVKFDPKQYKSKN